MNPCLTTYTWITMLYIIWGKLVWCKNISLQAVGRLHCITWNTDWIVLLTATRWHRSAELAQSVMYRRYVRWLHSKKHPYHQITFLVCLFFCIHFMSGEECWQSSRQQALFWFQCCAEAVHELHLLRFCSEWVTELQNIKHILMLDCLPGCCFLFLSSCSFFFF